jgi:hypothetical protein
LLLHLIFIVVFSLAFETCLSELVLLQMRPDLNHSAGPDEFSDFLQYCNIVSQIPVDLRLGPYFSRPSRKSLFSSSLHLFFICFGLWGAGVFGAAIRSSKVYRRSESCIIPVTYEKGILVLEALLEVGQVVL